MIANWSPLGKRMVRQAVFGENWELVACTPRDRAPAAVLLLTRLAIDPHVNWEAAAQAAARERCLDWIVMLQQPAGR